MNCTCIVAVVAVSALFVAACGGSAPPASMAPSAPAPESTPLTIEEAQAQIAAANEELGGSNAPGGDAKKKSESRPEAEPAAPADAAASTTPAEKPGDACVSPCRALASMRRAVDALCRMAGDTDKRCVDARQTLSDSVTRTSSCKCSG